jgi:hypothetical protein
MPVIANGTTSYGEASKRSYIATGVFNTYFYSYTSSRNASNQLVFTLAQNADATVLNCKAGHVLKENGRKLVYGVNNIDTNTTTTLTTSGNRPYYLVGVFDSSSMLSGFIDPNSPLFAPYSTDLPNFYDRSSSTVTGPDGTTNDMGAPVFTSGSVTAAGQVKSSTLTTLTAQTYSTGSASIPITINPTLGQVFTQTFTLTGGTNSFTITTAATPAVGSVVYLILKTSGTHTTAGSVAAGTNVKMSTVALGTAADRTFGLTFVSDGTNLVQVGGDVVAVAMV